MALLGLQSRCQEARERFEERLAGALRRDERGLSQSTETALLIAAAVIVAALIYVAVRALVESRLNQAKTGAAGVS
jgi:FlaG/FlaF family flagellin (archaellin)